MKTKTVAQRIRQARQELGFTQIDLAVACGFPAASRIGNYENETRAPNLGDIQKLAEGLGVKPSWLAFGDVEQSLARKVPLLSLQTINPWLNGESIRPTVRTIMQVSDASFALQISDPALDGIMPQGSIGIFDPERVKEIKRYRAALICYKGAYIVKKIAVEAGCLFFVGGILTLSERDVDLIAPLISIPEVPILDRTDR